MEDEDTNVVDMHNRKRKRDTTNNGFNGWYTFKEIKIKQWKFKPL